ncbi:hypothetical protein DWF00_02700 [Bosea caraganae]|uniref:Uncharacterized protein n=1 Tax=Bosea caraganae TaxID=2763117 RepID=A0A370L2Q6_9HYPH|nr:hypothetical protein [Bosea caraganae]RDJ22504.1 hypothetical protein DWE98_18865 [Bosea caraganae]RDJ30463.1 hypothetical protein DWF00_02700 [Bosea caraganae]
MDRRQFLMGLVGVSAAVAATVTVNETAQAFELPDLKGALPDTAAVAGTDAEYSFLIGRMTHRRRAGGWWRHRVAAARRWGRRGRPGRR